MGDVKYDGGGFTSGRALLIDASTSNIDFDRGKVNASNGATDGSVSGTNHNQSLKGLATSRLTRAATLRSRMTC